MIGFDVFIFAQPVLHVTPHIEPYEDLILYASDMVEVYLFLKCSASAYEISVIGVSFLTRILVASIFVILL